MIQIKEQEKKEDLIRIKKILDKHNIEFWLDCGTLLGAVRDGKFIPWDSDADLGVWKKDLKKLIFVCHELQKDGYKITLGRSGISIEKGSSFPFALLFYDISEDKVLKEWGDYRTRPHLRRFVDLLSWMFLTSYYSGINPFKIHGTKNIIRVGLAYIGVLVPSFISKWVIQKSGSITERYLSIIPKKYFVNLTTLQFYGTNFKAPNPTEEYLTYRYGQDWQIPKKQWVGEIQDGTIFKKDEVDTDTLMKNTL